MEFLAPFHPQIVHTPIVFLISSLAFDLVGRALDSEWWRKAGLALLVIGVLGAGLAVLSGNEASERAEKRQGIPEQTVDAHGDLAKIAFWLAAGALLTRAVARGVGPARGAVAGLSLLLHVGAAVTVGIAAHRGGQLVYKHGAGVSIEGRLLHHPGGETP